MSPEHKILHITGIGFGGAFNTAAELVSSQKRIGLKAELLVLAPNNHVSRWIYRIFSKIDYQISRDPVVSIFKGIAFSLLIIKNYKVVSRVNTIHLHWLPGYIPVSVFKLFAGRRIFWNIHDMNLFTGVCHNSFECEQFTKNCSACPQVPLVIRPLPYLLLKNKKRIVSDNSIRFIAPSKWILNKGVSSSILNGQTILLSPNPVDTTLFVPKNVNRNSEKEIIVGILGSNYEESKNAAKAIEAVELYAENFDGI